ncbi:hypothetical protein DY000_02040962 [Brassica cretica]|uniref:Uncharacterized protein n=1 Tax=Brassica cretica TaxID=69181 RepID=A0ABQ7B7H0_BRACR|nr:hypothetical protein DY000_02040962 [Brassica cretica]
MRGRSIQKRWKCGAVAFKNGGNAGRSIQKRQIKIRGAGKIESRRVLLGRGRNTLQGQTASKEPDVEHTKVGDSIGMQKERGGMNRLSCVVASYVSCIELSAVASRFSFRIEQTLRGSVFCNKGNALEVYGTSNGTHEDVGYVDMCVLNPVLGNRGRKWGRGGCYNWYQSQSVLKETPISSKVSTRIGSTYKSSNRDVVEF